MGKSIRICKKCKYFYHAFIESMFEGGEPSGCHCPLNQKSEYSVVYGNEKKIWRKRADQINKNGNCKWFKGYKEIKKFDENDNLIYFQDVYGHEQWNNYDKNNDKIHSRTYNRKRVYDKNNNKIHPKIGEWNKKWYKYDENHNKIYQINGAGVEWWWKFDENNNKIYYKYGIEENWYKYDENNRLFYGKRIYARRGKEVSTHEQWYVHVGDEQISVSKEKFESMQAGQSVNFPTSY